MLAQQHVAGDTACSDSSAATSQTRVFEAKYFMPSVGISCTFHCRLAKSLESPPQGSEADTYSVLRYGYTFCSNELCLALKRFTSTVSSSNESWMWFRVSRVCWSIRSPCHHRFATNASANSYSDAGLPPIRTIVSWSRIPAMSAGLAISGCHAPCSRPVCLRNLRGSVRQETQGI